MSKNQNYRTIIVIVIAIVIIIAGLLFFSTNTPTQQTQTPTTSAPSQLSQPVLLKGSGATFPEAQLRKWIQVFTSKNTDIKIEYSGVGSGQGISDFLNGLTAFGCSDVPLKTDQLNQAKSKYGTVYQVPYLLGGVAVVYNVPGLKDKQPLKLTPEVLVDILLGKINYWDDPKIKELNPELANLLPHKEIYFIHRSDASGTNEVFTSYLSFVSSEWKTRVGVGKTVQWPLDSIGRGQGAQGNPGVASMVQQTPYSIGYVELAYTKGLGVVALRNNAGKFVLPTPDRVSRAVQSLDVDFTSDIHSLNLLSKIFATTDPEAYPISTPTYMLLKSPDNYDPNTRKALARWLQFIATEGLKPENIVEGYAPIPQSIAQKILELSQLYGK
jgi:phosphate transport system substrate-binding protein